MKKEIIKAICLIFNLIYRKGVIVLLRLFQFESDLTKVLEKEMEPKQGNSKNQ
jgi:hypothetical protein